MTDSRVCYLVASDEHGVFGFGVFIPVDVGVLAGALRVSAAGLRAGCRNRIRRMFEWMWANTLARRIVAKSALTTGGDPLRPAGGRGSLRNQSR